MYKVLILIIYSNFLICCSRYEFSLTNLDLNTHDFYCNNWGNIAEYKLTQEHKEILQNKNSFFDIQNTISLIKKQEFTDFNIQHFRKYCSVKLYTYPDWILFNVNELKNDLIDFENEIKNLQKEYHEQEKLINSIEKKRKQEDFDYKNKLEKLVKEIKTNKEKYFNEKKKYFKLEKEYFFISTQKDKIISLKENEILLIERNINIPNIYKCKFYFDYIDYNKQSSSLVGIGLPLNQPCLKDYMIYKGNTKIVITGIEEDNIHLEHEYNVIILTKELIKRLYLQPDWTAQYFYFIKDINDKSFLKFISLGELEFLKYRKDLFDIDKKYNNKIKFLSEKMKKISKKLEPLFDLKNKVQTLEKEYIFELAKNNNVDDNLYQIRNKKVLNERRIYELDINIIKTKRLINKFKPDWCERECVGLGGRMQKCSC